MASVTSAIALSGCQTPDRPEASDPSNESADVAAEPVASDNTSPDDTASADAASADANAETTASDVTTADNIASASNYDPKLAQRLTDTARFLGGMPVTDDSHLATQQATAAWRSRAADLDGAWQQLDTQQLNAARAWASQELSDIDTDVVFYPFSGPDYLYATTFFPDATTYIMVGLEPVGDVPPVETFSPDRVQQKMDAVNQSLYAIVQYSFFRTLAMQEDLQEQGVTPILMLFAARTNHRILDVQEIGLDGKGGVQEMAAEEAAAQGWVPGVKVVVAPNADGDGSEADAANAKTIYYFSTDLSNSGLSQTPQFVEFVQQFESPVTYLKAASYLMHNESFSDIRDLILKESAAVLQDDSGIPVRFFSQSDWDRQFYGNYVRPIDLFAERYQSDLRAIYQSEPTEPLNFGIGYKYYDDSNLMLARSRS